MLEKIREAKKGEIENLKRREKERSFSYFHGSLGRFSAGLKGGVIAEYKRASPSHGDIDLVSPPAQVAAAYEKAGARAISVLTEEAHFKGSMDYLAEMHRASSLPLLRKDFIFHPLQVKRTLESPAAAMLLIVRLTPDPVLLRELRLMAEEGGVEAVVEVFAAGEVETARASGARIIQVNARDLSSLKVDMAAQLDLIRQCRGGLADEIWIAASGMASGLDLKKAFAAGFDCALVGASLMKSGRPGEALSRLLYQAAFN